MTITVTVTLAFALFCPLFVLCFVLSFRIKTRGNMSVDTTTTTKGSTSRGLTEESYIFKEFVFFD